MHSPRRCSRWAAAAAGAAAALLLAAPVSAHVTANPREAVAGRYTKLDFRVPHGCEGSPTTRVGIRIPAGAVSVKPEVVPGWTISITEGPLAEPVELHGETITEGVTEVAWTGGSLPDEHFVDFGLSLRMPDRAGETLYFPTVQTCRQGEHRWITIPVAGEEEPDEPAPAVKLIAAPGEEEPARTGDAVEQAGTEAGADGGEAGPAASTGGDGGTDGLAVAALVLAVAGVVLGGSALGLTARRKKA